MKRRVMVICFCLLMAVTSIYVAHAHPSEKDLATIVMVPLDDRPANVYFPEQVGKTAGMKIVTPPKWIIGSYTQPGDVKKVRKWLLDQATQADGFIISVSMTAYGGLIASRTGVLPLEEALEGVQVIRKLKELYPDKPVYVYDTIQRLAVTAISDEYEQYYEQVREWAILYDQVVNLGMEEYREELEALEEAIPGHVLDDYLQARARNHEVNKYLIDLVSQQYIDFLILAQDDAAQYGLHRAEREKLVKKIDELGVEQRATIFPGADEVDVVLVSRFVNTFFETKPKIYTAYSGVHGKEWIAPFEDTTFDENVFKHIVAAGGEMKDSREKADILLMLNTPSQSTDEREQDIDCMVDTIKEWLDDGKKVAIADVAYVNKADEALIAALTEEVDISQIFAYSGWNTAGNALGITVGHAGARHSFISQTSGFGVPMYKQTAKAHYEFLLHRFTKDHSYKNIVHPAANRYIEQLGASQWELGEHYDAVNDFVQEKMEQETVKWFSHFKNKSIFLGSRGNKRFYGTIDNLDSVHVKLPWPRIFEAELEPRLEIN